MMTARALVLHDLEVTGIADPATVSLLEDTLSDRGWWLEQWAEGAAYIAGLVAQDVQDALLETSGRWPLCRVCDDPDQPDGPAPADLGPHALYIFPDLGGPEPHWVCETSGVTVARLGEL